MSAWEASLADDDYMIFFEPHTVITEPCMAVDKNGYPWWIDPKTQRMVPAGRWHHESAAQQYTGPTVPFEQAKFVRDDILTAEARAMLAGNPQPFE